MHDEPRNYRIKELELFEYSRHAIRQHLRRDGSRYVYSRWGCRNSGSKGMRSNGDTQMSKGLRTSPERPHNPILHRQLCHDSGSKRYAIMGRCANEQGLVHATGRDRDTSSDSRSCDWRRVQLAKPPENPNPRRNHNPNHVPCCATIGREQHHLVWSLLVDNSLTAEEQTASERRNDCCAAGRWRFKVHCDGFLSRKGAKISRAWRVWWPEAERHYAVPASTSPVYFSSSLIRANLNQRDNDDNIILMIFNSWN